MDEAWERAVETALEGQADPSSAPPRTLTLDGVVKCLHGRIPSPALLERFQTLEHLSLANIGLASLERFPKLRSLQRLILSDNRISGGLEFLVEAGLDSLRDLDLSNNRIQFLEDLAPLAELKLVSLDLYECPVTRIGDYRSKVFGLIRSLKYLDKMDAEENERPETDDEEEDEEEEEEEDEEDPGNGEVDGEEKVVMNGAGSSGGADGRDADGVVDLDEDEESDAYEEEMDANGSNGRHEERRRGLSNGFRVAVAGEELVEDEDAEDEEYVEDEDEDLGEEIDEEGGEGEDEDVAEVHEIEDSEEEDGVEEEDEDDDDEVDEEEEEDEEDVEDGDEDLEPSSTGRLPSTEGEIDGHDQGEEDENGEIGEENGEALVERDYDVDDGDDEEDFESEYLVQPIGQPEVEAVGSDLEAGNDEDDSEEEVDDDEEDPDSRPGSSHPSSQLNKRKRDDDDDDDGLDDDSVEDSRSSKHR